MDISESNVLEVPVIPGRKTVLWLANHSTMAAYGDSKQNITDYAIVADVTTISGDVSVMEGLDLYVEGDGTVDIVIQADND